MSFRGFFSRPRKSEAVHRCFPAKGPQKLPKFHNCHINRAALTNHPGNRATNAKSKSTPFTLMNSSTENARDADGQENKPTINLARLVDEFVEKEQDNSTNVVKSAPVAYKPRTTTMVATGGKKKKQIARSRHHAGSGPKQGSWGGRITVAMVWLVTLGTGAGMAAYHFNPEFRTKFDQLAKRYLPENGMSLTQRLADPYKESMAKIETRGLSLEEASKAMGADPTKEITAEDNARFEAELAAMSGEESNVAVDRNRRMQTTFGGGGTLDLSKEREALAQKKVAEAKAK